MDGGRSRRGKDIFGKPTAWSDRHKDVAVVRATELGCTDDLRIPERTVARKEIGHHAIHTRIAQDNRKGAVVLVYSLKRFDERCIGFQKKALQLKDNAIKQLMGIGKHLPALADETVQLIPVRSGCCSYFRERHRRGTERKGGSADGAERASPELIACVITQ